MKMASRERVGKELLLKQPNQMIRQAGPNIKSKQEFFTKFTDS